MTHDHLIWSSSTNASKPGEINLFMAEIGFENSTKSISIPNSSRDLLKSILNTTSDFQKLHFGGEKHLRNVQQLTFGGQNAEGYFSFQDDSIVLQAADMNRYGTSCDQVGQVARPSSLDLPAELQPHADQRHHTPKIEHRIGCVHMFVSLSGRKTFDPCGHF